MLQFVPRSVWSVRRRERHTHLHLFPGDSISVTDTLSAKFNTTDEREVLAPLLWNPQTFTADISKSDHADLSIHFPSPRPQGRLEWDTAILDWHFSRDRNGQIKTAPAVIVLDILQGGNMVAGYIAKTLAKNGVHAFVLHLPQNGLRTKPGEKHDWNYFLPSLIQGACDARRARDVVATLPHVSGGTSLQGTSLGGFIATLAASFDDAFDTTLLALTGGDVFSILTTGKMDAARVRRCLQEVGYTDEKLKAWLWQMEPLRIAHRLNPKKTWLFSARYDQVVPAQYSRKLAQTIGLDSMHHRHLTGCHYTCAINAQRFLKEMSRALARSPRFSGGSLTAEAVSPVFGN